LTRCWRPLASALLGLLLVVVPVAGHGADAPPKEGASLSSTDIDARLADLGGASDLKADERSEIQGIYQRAKALLEAAGNDAAAAASYKAAVETAPPETRRLRDQLAATAAEPSKPTDLGVTDQTSLDELEQRLATAKADLAAAEAALIQRNDVLAAQSNRPAQAREELNRAQLAIVELRSAETRDTGATGPRAVAERTLRQAQLQAEAAEVARLEQEIASFSARLPLLEAQRDLAEQQLQEPRERVRVLQTLVSEKRRAEAAGAVQRATDAARESADKHPLVQTAAVENAAVARRLARLADRVDRVSREADLTQQKVREVTASFRRTQERVALAGVSTAVASFMMQQRRALNQLASDRSRVTQQLTRRGIEAEPGSGADATRAADLESLEIQEQRRTLSNLQGAVDDLMERVEPTMPAEGRAAIRAELTSLLSERQALLRRLDSELSTYLREVGRLEAAQGALEDTARAFSTYLDSQLLWLPSTYPVTQGSLENAVRGIEWVTGSEQWAGVRVTLLSDAQRHPALWILGALALVVLVLGASPLRQRLRRTAELVQRPATDRFALSLEALLVSALLAAPIPLVLTFLRWRLGATLETTDFTQALSHGLQIAARLVFGGLLTLVMIKPYGLAGAHFRWPVEALRLLRRGLRVWIPVAAPLVLVAASLSQFADESRSVGLGRSAFALLMLATAVFLASVLSPRGAIVKPFLDETPPRRLAQLWWLWYPVVVGTPLAYVVLADAGYYYTASVLARPFLQTLALFALAVVVYALALRWLAVTRRSLALQLAREDREAALALQGTAEGGATAAVPLTSARDDLAAIDAQTRQLLKTILLLGSPFALYAIWADTLPAFTLFQDITLWRHTDVLEGQTVHTAVTLGSLFVAILIGIVTGLAARNLPGMLEIVLLRHLRLKRGSRYAIKTLLQYFIVALGVLLAFGKLGASWSQVQWLVAALGVGLGFGLQEIFANFISGIIILFERPVRVGDRVTVGTLTGTVSKISIRSVTITDLDRKEIIVPNKSFITTDVVNWTLSDSITRIILRVGIAYGSDVKRAHQVMLDTVKALPLVRQDPKPEIWFAGFGESSLDFDIYVFASELSDRFPLMHAVNVAIEQALRDNGFEIPFPQRDLHLRTVDRAAVTRRRRPLLLRERGRWGLLALTPTYDAAVGRVEPEAKPDKAMAVGWVEPQATPTKRRP